MQQENLQRCFAWNRESRNAPYLLSYRTLLLPPCTGTLCATSCQCRHFCNMVYGATDTFLHKNNSKRQFPLCCRMHHAQKDEVTRKSQNISPRFTMLKWNSILEMHGNAQDPPMECLLSQKVKQHSTAALSYNTLLQSHPRHHKLPLTWLSKYLLRNEPELFTDRGEGCNGSALIWLLWHIKQCALTGG